VAEDCKRLECTEGRCQAEHCIDLVRNEGETDADCGSPDCSKCGVNQICSDGSNCTTGVCTEQRCAAATCEDDVRNGGETDVDCGGDCAGCPLGSPCEGEVDCASGACVDGSCAEPGPGGAGGASGAPNAEGGVSGSGGTPGGVGSAGAAGRDGAGGAESGGTGGAGGEAGHRYVRLLALSEVDPGEPFTSAAEFELLDLDGVTMSRAAWVVSADSEETVEETAPVAYAVDGDIMTYWHTDWGPLAGEGAPLPHWLQVDLGSSTPIGGFVYTPRQPDGGPGSQNGRIAEWRFYVTNDVGRWSSADPADWGAPAAEGSFSNTAEAQTVILP
jgi:hypothetical protein